jgi:hypothetical protein
MLRLILRAKSMARMLPTFKFEQGVKSSAMEAEVVLVVFRILNHSGKSES